MKLSRRGFSLLEVMVAIAILGFALSAILGAQGGIARSNKHAANLGLAMHLSRCKMTEIEEDLLRRGYPELEDLKNGEECCKAVFGSSIEPTGPVPFTCDTRIELVTLPDPPRNTLGGGDAGTAAPPVSSASPVGQLLSGQGLDLDGGLPNSLAGATGDQGGGGAGLISFVMGMVYPTLKTMMEASIRRVTVTVKWKEGDSNKDFTILQYVTNPQKGGLLNGVFGNATEAGNPAINGAGGTTGLTNSAAKTTTTTGVR